MRVVFAVKISDAVAAEVSAAMKAFPVRNPPWRWIPPENMHITLKFLGEVDERLLDDLRAAGDAAAAAAKPFRVVYGPFGAFPNLARPRVLFFQAVDGAESLAALARALEEGAERLGITREERPFRAHITLARIKEPLPRAVAEKLGAVPALSPAAGQVVNRFALMRSHLARSGATYEEVAGFPLA
jgi:2'-5' RNA ligase